MSETAGDWRVNAGGLRRTAWGGGVGLRYRAGVEWDRGESAAMNHAPGHDDLQLADYTGVLRRRWWLIFALAVIGLLASVGFFKTSHKVYIATASVLRDRNQWNGQPGGWRTHHRRGQP